MAQTEIRRIQDQLRRALEGGAWHGTALLEIVGDLEPGEAASRPLHGVHSPWEILLHLIVWMETVRSRLGGEPVEPTAAEDWPSAPEISASAWADLLDRLDGVHEGLQRTLERLNDADLERPVVGQAYSGYHMLHGVIQHTLYHAGQIAILAKAIRTKAAT